MSSGLRSQYQSGGNGTVTHGILSHNDEWQTLTLTLSGKEEKNGHVSKRYKCIDQLCVRRVHIVKLGRKSLIGHININSSVRTMTTHSDLSTTIITRAGYYTNLRDDSSFTITEMAPTRASPSSAFIFKNLLRHHAKQALTHRDRE